MPFNDLIKEFMQQKRLQTLIKFAVLSFYIDSMAFLFVNHN